MSKYYENMRDDFKDAVNIIKKYCQFEDCDESDCNQCPYPLSVIRCGEEGYNTNKDEKIGLALKKAYDLNYDGFINGQFQFDIDELLEWYDSMDRF